MAAGGSSLLAYGVIEVTKLFYIWLSKLFLNTLVELYFIQLLYVCQII